MMRKIFFGTLALAAALTISGTAAGQTKKRPKPLVTPLPTLSGAEIISRADDLEAAGNTVPVEKAPARTSTTSTKIRDLTQRIDRLESAKKQQEDPDAKQRRMLLNLDILTRAEQRAESLRKQLFDLTEKENSLKARLLQIDVDSRPDMIERTVQMAGSLRPEEVREAKRKTLDSERSNLDSLLTQLQTTRSSISFSLDRADAMVEKLRSKLEKEIDDTFLKADDPQDDPREPLDQ